MRIESFWSEIDAEWGLLTADEVSKALNRPEGEIGLVAQLRETGQLLAVIRGGDYVFPGFQFVSGHVEPVVATLVALAAELSWAQDDLLVWLCSPSGYFGGDRPVKYLHHQDELVEKARNQATVEW